MPRSKTTESRNNIHKGVRKLSKKTSKKGSKNKKRDNNTTTEDMLEILNSDKNMYTGNNTMNPQQMAMMKQYQNNVDPFMVDYAVQTDANGNMFNTNKIGALLGGVAQINSNTQYIPPMNLADSIVPPTNNMQIGADEFSSRMTLSPIGMMPEINQQMMPQMMPQIMPQIMPQMNHQMVPQMNQGINNSFIKNIANLGSVPRLV